MSINCSQKVDRDKNNNSWWSLFEIFQHFLTISKDFFTYISLRLQWLNDTGSLGVCDGPNSHRLAGWDFFVPWLAVKPQEPMTIAWVNRSQQLLQHVCKIPYYLQHYWNKPRVTLVISQCNVGTMIYRFKYHFPCIMYTILCGFEQL